MEVSIQEYKWIDDGIYTVTDVLTADECDAYVCLAESLGFSDAPIDVGLAQQQVVKDIRSNTRVMVDDVGRAQSLWERVRAFAPDVVNGAEAIGLNERFRFYRYEPGQSFRWHRDGAYQRPNGQRSRYTLLLYLNENFEGGETKFDLSVIKPKKGMALLFDHNYLHEGAEVTQGRKYVLRTDVMYTN